MAKAKANRESIGFIAETTWGETPSTPQKQYLNFTSTTLGQTNDSVMSEIIRSDTNVAGTIRTGINPGGDLGFELQYGGVDPFMEAALRNNFATALNVTATTISAANADNSFNDSGSGFGNAVAGQWIKVSGFANAANNGYFRVVTAAAGKLVVAGGTLTDEAATPSVTIKGQFLKNGVTDKSFTFERHFEDVTQFISMTGLRVSNFNLSLGLSAISSGSVSFLGKQAAQSTSTIFSSTAAAVTTESMNTVNDIKFIFIDDSLVTSDLTQLDLSISTNAQALKKLGALASAEVSTGSIAVTGTIGEYFEDASLLSRSLDFTETHLSFVIEDAAGNGYVFDMPSCRISGSPDNPGKDQQITVPYGFEATYDATTAMTIGITRIPA